MQLQSRKSSKVILLFVINLLELGHVLDEVALHNARLEAVGGDAPSAILAGLLDANSVLHNLNIMFRNNF